MTPAYLWVSVVQTLLRMLPFPCRTGLVRIGNPGRDAPVLLTGNFRLTVERVKRALAGMDAWLLVANSRGVNVWCAATGGLLTHHDVVSVLKTSGIAERVDHRRVILPQLAATGIEGQRIRQRTGFRVVWGPVEASAIPAFLGAGEQKTEAMRTVRFPWPQRLEMAVAWAFPISLLALLLWPLLSLGALPLVALVWAWSLVLFLAFPLYQSWLRSPGPGVGLVFPNFGPRGVPLLLWALFALALAGWAALAGEPWSFVWRWAASSLVVVLVLALDLTGSTPQYKSGLHADRLLQIELDPDRCSGAGFCEQSCPVDVFEIDPERKLALLSRAGQCVQCGACVVQCPFDALRFRSPRGDVVTPEVVRRFKLNLLGSRVVRADGEESLVSSEPER